MKEIIKRYQAILPCQDFIITGSYVTNMLMGIDGRVGDLDIILVKPTEESINTLKRLQESLSPELKNNPNYPLTVLRFRDDKTKIDIFMESKDRAYITLDDGIKVSPLIDIVKAKRGYNRPKDWFQLRKISRLFFKEEDFQTYLNNNG